MSGKDWLETLFPSNAERSLPWPVVGEVVTLYRPTGLHELKLLAASGWRLWPPRLPDQPIFYPVLNFEYAQEIARDWNAKRNDPPVGFVTAFDVRSDVATKYDIQVVGAQERHQELWVPAEELDAFNAALVGPIRVLAHYAGVEFTGKISRSKLIFRSTERSENRKKYVEAGMERFRCFPENSQCELRCT